MFFRRDVALFRKRRGGTPPRFLLRTWLCEVRWRCLPDPNSCFFPPKIPRCSLTHSLTRALAHLFAYRSHHVRLRADCSVVNTGSCRMFAHGPLVFFFFLQFYPWGGKAVTDYYRSCARNTRREWASRVDKIFRKRRLLLASPCYRREGGIIE